MKTKKGIALSTTQKIMLSFFLVIITGSILLALPISSATRESVSYIDALFTATTSVCVTGLVTVPTFSTWSIFGQFIILLLIQIGGLGVITIMTGVFIGLQRRIGLGDRFLLQDAFNLNSLSGVVNFTKKVIIGTFVVEGMGALLYMTVFVPQYGVKGVWISIFNAVSAFCNAGMDIIADNSLENYVTNPMINAVTAVLIIMGGIGYIVWWDVVRVLKNVKKQGIRCLHRLTFHSKLALWVTTILIIVGAVAIFIFEYDNPLTLQGHSLFDKIQISLFQSITTRTAGFATINQQNLTNASAMVSVMLMFIGGSPVGTAGGVKTVTMAVLLISAFATIRGRSDASIFQRTISKQSVSKAVAVVSMSFIIVFTSTLLLSAVTDAPALDIIYETASATATVGLSRNLTSSLDFWGKVIIIWTMYLGRIGPISLAIAFNTQKEIKNIIKNPVEEIHVG